MAGGANVYGFASGDPLNNWDPFGLECKDKGGKTIACPEPAGGPPVPLPGGRTWVPGDGQSTPGKDGETRGKRWKPSSPIPGGVPQPGGSWDPEGHWDVDNVPGTRGRRRFNEKGEEVTHDGQPVHGPQQFPQPTPGQVGTTIGLGMTYWIISESLRVLFPPRNLIPVP